MTRMHRTNPLTVVPSAGVKLLVNDRAAAFPPGFALMAMTAAARTAIRFAGGCSGMSADDKENLALYMREAFEGFGGVLFSRATRHITDDGDHDPMVTDIVGVLLESNPGCVGLGTVPRTGTMTLQGESQLVLDDSGNRPNPEYHGICVVQNGAEGVAEWDGDLAQYFSMMESWQEVDFKVGLVAWNGGGITKKEIIGAAQRGWPVAIVAGSGRACDEFAEAVASHLENEKYGVPEGSITVVNREHPFQLKNFLRNKGFLLETVVIDTFEIVDDTVTQ